MIRRKRKKSVSATVRHRIVKHFRGHDLNALVSSGRTFPVASRADLQKALDALFGSPSPGTDLIGFHAAFDHATASFSQVIAENDYPVLVAPLQYDEIDVGEMQPHRCLKNALWICRREEVPFVLMMTPALKYGQVDGVRIEVAVPAGEARTRGEEGPPVSRASRDRKDVHDPVSRRAASRSHAADHHRGGSRAIRSLYAVGALPSAGDRRRRGRGSDGARPETSEGGRAPRRCSTGSSTRWTDCVRTPRSSSS